MLSPLSLLYVYDLEEWNWLCCKSEFIISVFAVIVFYCINSTVSDKLKALWSIQSNEEEKRTGWAQHCFQDYKAYALWQNETNNNQSGLWINILRRILYTKNGTWFLKQSIITDLGSDKLI